jgi:hypothetical protein
MTKEQAYEQATLESLSSGVTGTRMDVIYLAMDIYAKAALQLEKEPEDRWIAVSEVEIEQLFRDNFDCYADNSTDGADGQIIYGENEPAMTLPVFTKLYKVAMCPFHKPAPLTKDCPHLSSHIDNNGGCYCDTCGKMMEP